MRLYIVDPQTKQKIYIKKIARNRSELTKSIGTNRFVLNKKLFTVNSVLAEPNDNTAAAMALGGVVGVLGGVPGVVLGGMIGGMLGKSADEDDKKLADAFNRS